MLITEHRGSRLSVLLGSGTLRDLDGHGRWRPPRVLAKMATHRRYRDSAYLTEVAADLYGGSARTHPEAATRLLHQSGAGGSNFGYYCQLLSMAGWSTLPFLSLIPQPTLVMGGDDDPIIPASNPRMQACLIPDARLNIYRGGHLSILTEADELVRTVERLLCEDRTRDPRHSVANRWLFVAWRRPRETRPGLV